MPRQLLHNARRRSSAGVGACASANSGGTMMRRPSSPSPPVSRSSSAARCSLLRNWLNMAVSFTAMPCWPEVAQATSISAGSRNRLRDGRWNRVKNMDGRPKVETKKRGCPTGSAAHDGQRDGARTRRCWLQRVYCCRNTQLITLASGPLGSVKGNAPSPPLQACPMPLIV